MELQLGLALPTASVFGFDLNSFVYEPKDVGHSGHVNHRQPICLQLGPQLAARSDASSSSDGNENKNNKRSFYVAFNELRACRDNSPDQTLPLLLWNNQPNDEDDDDRHEDSENHSALSKFQEDGDDGIVGWPPIKYQRKRTRVLENNRRVNNGCADCHGRPSNYVKVKMDGVAIARKIDLRLYGSFQALKENLLGMFGIYEENSSSYRLAYQDREGDWLLAADDVSWRSFIRSVKRLKLMKNN